MNLDINRWASMSLAEQMANTGSEVGRSAKWLAKGNKELADGAYLRALDLIDLTIAVGRHGKPGRHALLKELCRARDCYTEAFLDRDLASLNSLDKYFYQFALLCRKKI